MVVYPGDEGFDVNIAEEVKRGETKYISISSYEGKMLLHPLLRKSIYILRTFPQEMQIFLKPMKIIHSTFLTVTGTDEEGNDYSESSGEDLEPEYIKTDTPDGFKIGLVHSCT